MRFIRNGTYSYHNVEALKSDFIDLIFCLDIAKCNRSTSEKSIRSFKNDVSFALRLLISYQEGELSAEEIPGFTEFTSNLYTLLYDSFYEPAYLQHDDYNTFLMQFEGSTYEKSDLR